MKKDTKRKTKQSTIPDRMFQDVKIPESLAPTPINPAIDEANQLNIPRNPAAALHALDWEIPSEPLATDPRVPSTPNPHTDKKEKKKRSPDASV